MDDDQARRLSLLLLGKGAVLEHRFDRPLAPGSDEYEQRPARDGGEINRFRDPSGLDRAGEPLVLTV